MRFETAVLCLLALAPQPIYPQTRTDAVPVECVEVDTQVRASVNIGNLAGAEAVVSRFLDGGKANGDPVCAGVALHNLAVTASSAGQFAQAEALEHRALQILKSRPEAMDPVLLRPILTLWFVRFQQGEFGRAREALRDLRAIPLTQPEDRAIVSGVLGTQLGMEGRHADAEREFQNALREWHRAGRGRTPGAAALLADLGSLYGAQGQYENADRAFQGAFDILGSSNETLPEDRMKISALRGFLRVREERWREAAEDLSAALMYAERETASNPLFVKRILTDYALVLRKLDRKKEARSVADRARLIGTPDGAAVVDVSQLAAETKRTKKQ